MKLECEIHRKMVEGKSLSENDYHILGEIIKDVLTFMAKEKIIPSPQNYERWFKVFCYIKEKGLNLSKSELLDLYLETYGSQMDNSLIESSELVEKIAEELYNEVKNLIKGAADHQERLSEGGEKLEKLSKTTSGENIQEVLTKIMEEVKGLKNLNKKFINKLEEQTEEIEKLRKELRKVKEEANIDPLTGLRNRRSFERALLEFFKDFKKFGYPFSIIMMDIDNFKDVNDTYGHLAGDKVLKEIGGILRNHLRAKDIPARTGGEEFTIILPGIRKKEAISVAERLRRIISSHPIEADSNEVRVTASFGVSEVGQDIEEPEDLLREADKNLYRAKRTGKDKVVG